MEDPKFRQKHILKEKNKDKKGYNSERNFTKGLFKKEIIIYFFIFNGEL
jgi:hypothetical protein